MISTTMSAGERIYHRQAGGGGWGDPMERDPEAVARDVKNGKVSVKQAREQYGVVLDPTNLAVCETETADTRQRMAAHDAGRDRRDSG
jgi:N-methylhydantoinase B